MFSEIKKLITKKIKGNENVSERLTSPAAAGSMLCYLDCFFVRCLRNRRNVGDQSIL